VDQSWWKVIKKVRKKALFTLDELVDALLPYINNLNRDNCFRILKHYRLNRLDQEDNKKRKKFATYKPGFLHIDIFYLPKLLDNGVKKRTCCFLAIDRATRMLFLSVYERHSHIEATDFLMKCLNFFPFRIHHILTDNGTEFTLKKAHNKWGKIKSDSFFDIICHLVGIKRRLTKAYHPWTNGMAERAVRTVKEHTIRIEQYPDIPTMIEAIKKFQNYHNRCRRLRVLGKKTPHQVTMEWFVKEPDIFIVNPTDMFPDLLTT